MRRVVALCIALALAPALALAQTKQTPPPEILALANAVMTATNANDASGLANLYTDQAIVVDENPPFLWSGSNAGANWWHVVDAIVAKMKLTSLKAVPSPPSEFVGSATDAYMIVPTTLSGVADGKPFNESGTMTYTFHKTSSGWKISSQVWTTGSNR